MLVNVTIYHPALGSAPASFSPMEIRSVIPIMLYPDTVPDIYDENSSVITLRQADHTGLSYVVSPTTPDDLIPMWNKALAEYGKLVTG